MDLIIRANWENVKEEKNMCEALRELFADELRESEEKDLQPGRRSRLFLLCARSWEKTKGCLRFLRHWKSRRKRYVSSAKPPRTMPRIMT